VCTGELTKYCSYSGFNNFNFTHTGTIKFLYTPNYSGIPASTKFLFRLKNASNLNNQILLSHQGGSGNTNMAIYSSTGTLLANIYFGAFLPVAGTEYEICVTINISTGANRLFINGVQLGSTDTNTGVRTADNLIMEFGGLSGYNSNGSFDKLYINSTVLHTSNYTPDWSSIYETIYVANKVDLPSFPYSGIGSIQALTGFTTTETDAPRYSINSKYWSGSEWVTSNGTYAQASPKIDANINIGTLTIVSTYAVSILFTDSNTQASVDILDILYTGQKYNSNGWFKTVSSFTAETLLATYRSDAGFLSVSSIPTNTVLKYALEKDGTLYYWSGSAIAVSDGSESKTNTEADILSNILAFVTTIQTIKIYYYLKTTDTTITPTITSNKVAYDFGGIIPAPTTCIVWGYYRDINGNGVNDATVSFTLKRNKNQYKEASSSIVEQNKTVVTGPATDIHWADGYFEMELIRSSQYEGSGKYYVAITKSTTLNTSKSGAGQKLEITVPDQVSVNITSLITAT